MNRVRVTLVFPEHLTRQMDDRMMERMISSMMTGDAQNVVRHAEQVEVARPGSAPMSFNVPK